MTYILSNIKKQDGKIAFCKIAQRIEDVDGQEKIKTVFLRNIDDLVEDLVNDIYDIEDLPEEISKLVEAKKSVNVTNASFNEDNSLDNSLNEEIMDLSNAFDKEELNIDISNAFDNTNNNGAEISFDNDDNNLDISNIFGNNNDTNDFNSESFFGDEQEEQPQEEMQEEQPQVKSTSLDIKDESGMSVSLKMTRALKVMKLTSPFSYAIYSNLLKEEHFEIGTAGTDGNVLVYNPNWFNELTEGQILFVLRHEIYHVLMEHRKRMKTRNHELWNHATDIFINTKLANEYGMIDRYNNSVMAKHLTLSDKKLEETFGMVDMPRTPDGEINGYIDTSLNTNEISAELIYDELLKENQEKMQQQDFDENEEEDQNQQCTQQSGGRGQNDDQNQEGDNQNGNGQGQQNNQNQNQNGQGNGQEQSNSQSIDEQMASNSEKIAQERKQHNYTYHGKPLGDKTFSGTDLREIIKETLGKTEQEKHQMVQSLLNSAKENVELKSPNCGDGEAISDFERRMLDIALEKTPKWKNAFEDIIKKRTKEVSSFQVYNKRLGHLCSTIPGKAQRQEGNEYDNVKICIDVSGSVSDELIGRIKAATLSCMKTYKIKGEIIYWSTSICKIEELKNKDDIRHMQAVGNGGTNPECLFEYFKNKKKCTHEPAAILIFTDGYFSTSFLNRKKENGSYLYKDYRNKIIWILVDKNDYRNFTVPTGTTANGSTFEWGKKAPLDFDD